MKHTTVDDHMIVQIHYRTHIDISSFLCNCIKSTEKLNYVLFNKKQILKCVLIISYRTDSLFDMMPQVMQLTSEAN